MIDRYNLKNPTVGTLYITATHIIFVDPDTNKETWVGVSSPFLLQPIPNNRIMRHFRIADFAHAHWQH